MLTPHPYSLSWTVIRVIRGCIFALWVFSWGAGSLSADTILYSDDPTNVAYDDITNTLKDVYGTSDLSNGQFSEVNYGLYLINGTGDQSINMTFLYDDGDYTFSFGYFEVTAALQALPSDTIAEKEAWAVEALSTAQVVFVDKNASFSTPSGAKKVTTDTNDVYTSANNDATRNHDTGSGNSYDITNDTNVVTLQGGHYYSFFIIPDNSLENFLGDYNDNGVFNTFSLDGSGTGAWPLFAVSQGNPGPASDGSGEGTDQAFTFFGTTRNINGDALANNSNGNFAPDPNSPGSVITFEDIRRGTGGGSDNDFNDLHFYIDNTSATGIVVPEPSTWAGMILLAGFLAVDLFRRVRGRGNILRSVRT